MGAATDLYDLRRDPGLTAHDVVDGDVRYAVFAGECGLLAVGAREAGPDLGDLLGGQLRTGAAAVISRMSDGLEVLVVNAPRVSAKMIELAAEGDASAGSFVGGDVGALSAADAAVTMLKGAEPSQARRLVSPVYLHPELGGQGRPGVELCSVPPNETERLAAYMAEPRAGLTGDRCELSASALAKTHDREVYRGAGT